MRPNPASVPATLARRIKCGDADAEEELVVRYRAALTMLLRRQVRDAALAEDLCHEVFRIALPALRAGRLADEHKLTGYLWGIARHLAARARRDGQRRGDPRAAERLPDRHPGPDEQLLMHERATLLRSAMRGLRARDRAVLSAFYFADTPKEHICRRFGITAPQFALIKYRALKRLLASWRSAHKRS
jgi:RNA polymerase sigma factor (sigma-70 family)